MSLKQKYYAVKQGRTSGILESWEECLESVKGFKGAEHKSFNTKEEALNYLSNTNKTEITSDIVCYVDGSYNIKTKEYSFGAIIVEKGEVIAKFNRKFESDEYSSARNVAGEVRGASFIINYCYKKGYKEIDLVYDYKGIKEFYDGSWNTNTPLTQKYREFALTMEGKIKVNFIKVKSHSNDFYNDMVDTLAKEALGI